MEIIIVGKESINLNDRYMTRYLDDKGAWWYTVNQIRTLLGVSMDISSKTAKNYVREVNLEKFGGKKGTTKVVSQDGFIHVLKSIKNAKKETQERISALKKLIAQKKKAAEGKNQTITVKGNNFVIKVSGPPSLFSNNTLKKLRNFVTPLIMKDSLPTKNVEPSKSVSNGQFVDPPKLVEHVDLTGFYTASELIRDVNVSNALDVFLENFHPKSTRSDRAKANTYCDIVKRMGLHPLKLTSYTPPPNLSAEREKLTRIVKHTLDYSRDGQQNESKHSNAQYHTDMNSKVIDYIATLLANKAMVNANDKDSENTTNGTVQMS